MEKNLIIDEKDKTKFEIYLLNYGYVTIINDFKYPFIYDSNNDLFLHNTNCLSLIELFNFDRQISSYILKNILNIERRLANSVSIIIEDYIVNNIKNIEKEYSASILNENSEIFHSIFSKFRTKDKKRILSFLEYIINNNINKNNTIENLIYQFKSNKKEKIDLNLFKEIFEISDEKLIISKTKINFIFNNNEWQKEAKQYFNSFTFKIIKNLMLKNFNDSEVSNDKLKNMSITELSKKWTLGNLIKIFNYLNPKLKNKILKYMFENNHFKYDNNFINEFIEIMNLFKIVRNKICHNEPIYDFNCCCYNIYNFLKINSIEIKCQQDNVYANIYIVIQCLVLFDKFTKFPTKKDLSKLIRECFDKIVKTNLNENSFEYIKKKFGFS